MLTQQWTLILMLSFPWQFAVSSAIITLCTMTTLFQYSDKLLVFDYFFTFGLSAITMSFPISTFFTRAKTAIAVGTLSFIGAFFHYYTVNDETVSMAILLLLRHFSNNFSSGNNETAFYTCRVLKVMASFLSPTSFALGSMKFADYERGHVGLRWSNIWRESSGVCFLVCLLMMLFDTVLYGAVGLYLDKVLSRENGLHFPWNPTFWKSFWRKKNTREHHASTSEVNLIDNSDKESENLFGEPVRETISLEMKQQQIDGRCIQIRNLQKVYSTNRGNFSAVRSLQLTLYENQILF